MSPRDQSRAVQLLRRWRTFVERMSSTELVTLEQLAALAPQYQELLDETVDFLDFGPEVLS